MPKKLQTNQKAADARARKDAIKQAEKDRIQKAKEDEYWKDDDKQLAKKQARKEERERKEAEERERKKEREKLLQEELAQIKGKESSDVKVSTKVTRSQIEKHLSTLAATNTASTKDSRIVEQDLGKVENLNKVPGVTAGARTVDEAIHLMTNLTTAGDADFDRHPERRQKAAWEAFETARLPILKAENPNLRLSQLRQMIRKEWQKSPDNPLNARILAYNAKKTQLADQATDSE